MIDDMESRRLPKCVHPYWLAYELQRHLQLAKAILKDQGTKRIGVVIDFQNVDGFSMGFMEGVGAYQGHHDPVVRDVSLTEIHDHDGPSRNIASPAVKDILDEISRIFGFPSTQPDVWDANDYLKYVKGLENTR
jgi:hypothetical protein